MNEWRFIALVISLYSTVFECFKKAKVSLEILDWLSKEGKGRLRVAVKGLVSEYQESLPPVVEPFLTFVRKVKVFALPAKKTTDCFTDEKRYSHRDRDLDRWLPEDQEAEIEGGFDVQVFTKPAKLVEFLDFQVGRQTADIAELSLELKDRGYTTTLTRIEDLIEKQESGFDAGLLTYGKSNLFLVLDKKGNVCAGCAHLNDGRWSVMVRHLDYAGHWPAGNHLFLRN